jgi:hypothetical protein
MTNTHKAIMLILSVGAAWFAINRNSVFGFYFILLAIIFTLWIDYSKVDQNLVLAIFISACSFYSGLSVLGDEKSFLKVCQGRRRILCEIENLLFSIGGVHFVATFYFVLGIILFHAIRYSKYNSKKY